MTLLNSLLCDRRSLLMQTWWTCEAQRKDKETRNGWRFSLFEEALLVFEAQDLNVEQYIKAAAAYQHNPRLLCYLWWERKSCYPGMTGSFCQERGQNWMSEIAAGPPCPIADDPSALPTPTFSISSSQYLFLHILSVPAPVCQLLYCTTLLLRYCTVRLKHFFIFCVCWLFNVLFAGNVV